MALPLMGSRGNRRIGTSSRPRPPPFHQDRMGGGGAMEAVARQFSPWKMMKKEEGREGGREGGGWEMGNDGIYTTTEAAVTT